MITLFRGITLYLHKFLIFAVITPLVWALWKVLGVLYRRSASALRSISGPASTHWFYGNAKQMMTAVSTWLYFKNIFKHFSPSKENAEQVEAWESQYGPTFTYHSLLKVSIPPSLQPGDCVLIEILQERHLCTLDLKAINHILHNSYNYQKPKQVRNSLSRTLGYGLVCVEEDQHKLQRRIMVSEHG